jgi:hypothetical protein
VYAFQDFGVITGSEISVRLRLNDWCGFEPLTWSIVSIDPNSDQMSNEFEPEPVFPADDFLLGLVVVGGGFVDA